MNYYNEFDPHAAAWLRQLIAEGLIPPGEVDQRSIIDVKPHELTGYTQQHFFCGIGGWPLALRLAGWPDTRPVRTGSCPCQPFSQAGQQRGEADERHVWPFFRDLITFGEPTVTFGEQVASRLGREWLSGIRADLEGLGYAVGAADLCAAGQCAPHIRQRLYWVADAQHRAGCAEHRHEPGAGETPGPRHAANGGGDHGRLADAPHQQWNGNGNEGRGGRESANGCDADVRLADQPGHGRKQKRQDGIGSDGGDPPQGRPAGPGLCGAGDGLGDTDITGFIPRGETTPTMGYGDPADAADFWDRSQWIPCRDGKHRRIPTEPALFPLADGLPYKLARRGSVRPALLKGAGNAIVPQVAATFIQAFLTA